MNQNNNTNKLYKVSSMKEYMQDCFKKDVEDFACSAKIKSGFANLDAITSLYPGFYVLGAISSLGKTTFMLQMSDQIAKTGEKVMFFSYEQNRLELASKSISRLMWEKNKKTSGIFNSTGILILQIVLTVFLAEILGTCPYKFRAGGAFGGAYSKAVYKKY